MEVIDQIRQTANIIEIASQYTTLKRSGRRHVGLCPFHSEKTPSFFVDDDKQLYHCFGCGAGGDIFTLLMEKEKFTFPEAVRFLAEKYNIPLPDKKKFSPQYQSLKASITKVTEEALAFFKKNLFNTTEGQKALAYLKKRNISDDMIQKLKLGYALNSWDGLLSFFRRKQVSPALLEQAGLILRRQNKEGYYDRFRGRVIFPIFDDRTGNVVAFGGRSLFDEEPKYLNSPDTPVYSKGNLLYGLNFSREDIRRQDELILVEGYTDYLALYQAGITYVAASLGTSLTPQQIDLARRRYTSKIIACYDGDTAGRKAAYRAVSLCFEQGAEIRVVNLPQGSDPDSIVVKKGPKKFLSLVSESLTGLEFLISYFKQGKTLSSPEEKARIAREVFNEIRKIPDAIVRSEYLRKISEQLDIDEKELRKNIKQKIEPQKRSTPLSFLEAERRLLQIIFHDDRMAAEVFKAIRADDYQNLISAPIFTLFAGYFKQGKTPDFHEFKQKIEAPLFSTLSQALLESAPSPNVEEMQDCLSTLRQYSLSQQLKRLKSQIAQMKQQGEQEKITPLLNKIMDIHKNLYELNN
jgi:DNA primase